MRRDRYGETGTGKELVARALHAFGPRRNGPVCAVNCSRLPSCLNRKLFGHERGAFTAPSAPTGALRAGSRGTIFLDEVGDMPLRRSQAAARA